MSRSIRLLLVLAAWMVPVAWIGAELGTRPSDGTVVWSSPLLGGAPWGSTVSVRDTYGQTLLLPGDVLLTIDGQPVRRWLVSSESAADVSVGDEVRYLVRRIEDGSPREYDRTASIATFPLGQALLEDLPRVLVALLMLLAGSVAFLVRPDRVATWAFLASSALLPLGLASWPWGAGAVDLVGGRGLWPLVVSELTAALGVGLALLAMAALPTPSRSLSGRPWLVPAIVLWPLTGYAAWAAVVMTGVDGPARTQAMLSIAIPALVIAVPSAFAVLVTAYLRAPSREARLAARLVLLVLSAGLALRLLLGDLPRRLTGDPFLPLDVLLVLIAIPVLAGVVVALVGYRLDDVEPAVRRTVGQGAVAATIGVVFVAIASAFGRAAEVPVGAILAGGLMALLVLPLAVALQRRVRHRLYGDRELPRSIVAELRRLDSSTTPAAALTETLALLSRRLRVTHASVEVPSATAEDAVLVSVGEPRGGSPVTVELVAGGAGIGTLCLEADPDRDPFGRGDRRLLEDVGAQVGALVQAVLVNRELLRSRQGIVTAREEERRRLRRDLHDGLGPSLATMAMRLESVQDLALRDPERAADALSSLASLAREEIVEVRRLVDGLRPAALDQLGLVSALRARADHHESGSEDGAPVLRVEAHAGVEPLPAAVEVAAYRIALEAVTNAVRHSAARRCTVSLRKTDGRLELRVEDDGVGLAENRSVGVGLSSMGERAAELGGTCTVTSNGHGTVVEALLPLGSTEGRP